MLSWWFLFCAGSIRCVVRKPRSATRTLDHPSAGPAAAVWGTGPGTVCEVAKVTEIDGFLISVRAEANNHDL